MRRCLSSLLLLVTLMTSVAPMLALAPRAVPACCRADGKHHCTAMMKLGADGFRAEGVICPFRRVPATVRTNAALYSSRTKLLFAATRSELCVPCVADRDLQSLYALPKRGPPLA